MLEDPDVDVDPTWRATRHQVNYTIKCPGSEGGATCGGGYHVRWGLAHLVITRVNGGGDLPVVE